jgi:hypothetical protein
MDTARFARFARTLTGGSRRHLFAGMALSGAALSLANASEAKKHNKHKKHKNRCQPQVDQCVGAFTEVCNQFLDIDLCLSDVAECCAFLGNCDAASAMACIVSRFILV